MNGIILVILGLLLIGTVAMVAMYLGVPIPGLSSGGGQSNLQSMVAAQRQQSGSVQRNSATARKGDFSDLQIKKSTSSVLTLEKRLKFAQWRMSTRTFYMLEMLVSAFALMICLLKFNIVFQFLSLTTGPLFLGWLLNLAMDKRFKAFDDDYPSFLLSIVSLIKTGMNTMSALEAAARALEDGSLVRTEIELMVERLRAGVAEEKSIGTFGEDIYHPEIELFVQALLLSRRVGGTLSDTLERLAKQVRRRQFFRSSAMASVAQQRGSIWFIIVILIFIEVYLYVVYPQAVVGPIKDPLGWQIFQTSFLFILGGMFWVRQVTKIRI